ncbi:BTB/POZ protein [Aspergillus avenaceus]|uniref:BTB/POZ protein n=1 Tax=Aspergillus avenaceus TaxID=36643 RepID=A0A5N6TUK3_ASPAV|nr:BTB/POZ protein [Aspergillus avenaceus]
MVTLQVGDRRFTTTHDTLVSQSTFFDALLSSRWAHNQQSDGSYFVDADPDLFEHILRFLRRGVCPLFYDHNGHNYGLYLALLQEARYFGIDGLEKWLENKKYHNVVTVEREMEVLDDSYLDRRGLRERLSGDVTEELFPQWGIRKTYICPRRIPSHQGAPSSCGRKCMSAKGDDGDEYERNMQ